MAFWGVLGTFGTFVQGGFDPNKSFGVKLEMDARFLGLGAKPDLH